MEMLQVRCQGQEQLQELGRGAAGAGSEQEARPPRRRSRDVTTKAPRKHDEGLFVQQLKQHPGSSQDVLRF